MKFHTFGDENNKTAVLIHGVLCPWQIFINIMTNNYISIIRKSKKRDPKVIASFKESFLPEKYLDPYLKIADNMEEDSIRNILGSVFRPFEFKKINSRILFIHGTKGNESVSAKSARKMKAVNPQTEIKVYKGYAHGELLCFEPSKWVEETSDRFM